MDSWGCEFLEDNGSIAEFSIKASIKTFYMPMHILSNLVDDRYLAEISIRDSVQIQALTADISIKGILKPGELIYDNNFARLQDGNHRYLAAKRLGLEVFPVRIVRVSEINAAGASMEFLFSYFLSLLPD
jgi:ParB-like chromosome segregation protein Spo0J